jgi:hypothetical protein
LQDDYNELKQTFISIITKGRKDNTYKFALAKFLLDYCNKLHPTIIQDSIKNNQSMFIDYQEISNAFLSYFWHQECKYKIRQNFHQGKDPSIINIIRDVFGTQYIPKSFKDMPIEKIHTAQNMVKHKVFGYESKKTSIVIPRFQNIKQGKTIIQKNIFYNYDDNDAKLELKPQAIKFFSENYTYLIKTTLLEWCKFLEKINTLPRLIAKVESYEIKRNSLQRYVQIFKDFRTCFYCNASLDLVKTHVDHFIPWSYIFEDECWNLVLSCSKCNLKKSDALANDSYLSDIIKRNQIYKNQIKTLQTSLEKINTQHGWENEIEQHYRNCQEYGFSEIKLP